MASKSEQGKVMGKFLAEHVIEENSTWCYVP